MLERFTASILRWISAPGSSDPVQTNRIRLLNAYSLIISLIAVLVAMSFAFTTARTEVIGIAIGAALVASAILTRFLLVRKRFDAAAGLTLGVLAIIGTLMTLVRGVGEPIGFAAFISLLILSGFLLGSWYILLAALFIAIIDFTAHLATSLEFIPLIPEPLSPVATWQLHTIVYIFVAVMTYLFISNLQDALKRVEHELHIRQQAERALGASEARNRMLVDGARDVVFTTDVNGRIASLNPAFENVLGHMGTDWLGKSFLDLTHPDDQALTREQYNALVQARATVPPTEIRWVHAEGHSVYMEISASLYAYGGEPLIVGIARDTTARREAENMMQQAQKLDSLGLLAGSIAHDFNNLLVGMLGQTTLALQKLPPSSPATPPLTKATRAAERAAEITRQLLAYSGRGQFQLATVNLNSVVEDNLQLLYLAVPKHIFLNTRLAELLPPIEADRGQIQQVVMNLILNAAQAIGDEKGSVVITTGTCLVTPADKRFWELTGRPLAPGSYVTLKISDTGRGIPAETLRQIFEPFYSTKEDGNGLGLAAVLGIVRGHRGGIHVSSTLGHGTTFTLVFPAVAMETAVEPLPAAPLPAVSGTLLVIDDEEPVRDAVADILGAEGLTVLTASSGREGLQILESRRGEIDLVLLDLTMPGMSGEETYHAIREIDAELDVLLSSGYNEQEAMQRFLGKGTVGFLQKPYSYDMLIAKVHEYM